MTAVQQVQQHPASVDAYIRHGWSLVPIPAGTKGPRTAGWNLRENALKSQSDLPPGYGIGLAHAYSGTMAFDIDDWEVTKSLGIDVDALYNAPDAVVIDSGKPGHGKLLYAMPFGMTLPSKKILHNGAVAYELRCATANGLTVQDVLPPSIHPEMMSPYRWGGRGHWMRLPFIPPQLLEIWEKLADEDKQSSINTGGKIDASWQEIKQALEHISPDCSREEWVNCGMALHWAGSQTDQLDQALQLWNDWSTGSDKYPGEKGIVTQWRSFRSDKSNVVKLGTLFAYAKQNGWERPQPDVSDLFKEVNAVQPKKLSMSMRPQAPDLDFDIVPDILRKRSIEVGNSIGCDPLIPFFAGLSVVSGAMDAQSRLELLPGFQVPPVLWVMTIGAPADRKSPGSKPMMAPLTELQNEDKKRFAEEYLKFEAEEARYSTAKKAFIEHATSPEAMLENTLSPAMPAPPKQPVPLKIMSSDVTSQKVVRQASDRPRGLLLYLDEMADWVKKVCDPRSGENRSTWTVAYESDWYEMDRVGAGTIYCENFAISIFGNIQPRVFRNNIAQLSEDGLVQRFIPVVLRSEKTKLGNPVPTALSYAATYNQMVRMVYGLPAMTYRLSIGAYKAFREFQVWYEQAKRDYRIIDVADTFQTAFGKLEGLTGRIMLIWHVVETPFSLEVSEDLARRVILFVQSYIIPALKYTHDSDLGGASSFDQWLADYVIHHCNESSMSLSDIKHGAKRQLKNVSTWEADQKIFSGMYGLEKAGWVLRTDDRTQEHRHIAQWAINPSMITEFADYRREVMEAKQRQLDHIYRLSTKESPV